MDITSIILAAGIPTGVTSFFFWYLKKMLERREHEREKADQVRNKNVLMLVKAVGASLALGEATAKAVQRIPDAHCNGDMHSALEYAQKIKHEHKDFLYEQAVDNISD